MDVRVLPDAAACAEAAADLVARAARAAVRRRGRFVLAVSGGSTPDAMFAALCERDVPWERVVVHQVDERVAPDGSPDRNATHLDEHLLGPLESRGVRLAAVRLLPVGSADLRAAARRAAGRVEADLPFDLVHLGIGDDGHTASWPPGDPVVHSSALVAAVGPFNGHVRLTLTPPVVNGARRRLVVVAGESKADAVARWARRDATVPVRWVRRTGTVALVDAGAAASVAAWSLPRAR